MLLAYRTYFKRSHGYGWYQPDPISLYIAMELYGRPNLI
jgi:hypothetical protein